MSIAIPVPVVSDKLDLNDPALTQDPYVIWRGLREGEPVSFNEVLNAWVVTTYDDVLTCFKNPLLYNNVFGDMSGNAPEFLKPLLGLLSDFLPFIDPPKHTELRHQVTRAFTPGHVEKMRSNIKEIAQVLIDEVKPNGQMEFISEFAYILPIKVIAGLLGVDPAMGAQFKHWADTFIAAIAPAANLEALQEGSNVVAEMKTYFGDLLAERQRLPGDDLISGFIQVGGPLSTDHIMSLCINLLLGGYETVASTLPNGLRWLLEDRRQWQLIQDTPALIKSAAEELLRYDTSVQMPRRVAVKDIALNGKTICAGQQALLVIGSANRDPSYFADPDTFDVERIANRHLTFGNGIHFCVGAPLARLEIQCMLECLSTSLPDLRLAQTSFDYTAPALRKLKTLNVVF